ncbi:SsgA family sporulation/cell division regulator [Streptomyces zingiberis]|uniref:SsgA family sporulation/cell division regulator n=1 Tax=Streptomyces zingiberis TaxID=2053010 RepID=A0ABX1BVV9_9ACTN|nr:SsgA family sporulation/cell division regulator [Streptomyces zingiberis]NJQ01806.1 SsgA family sporulation/cell division regulator [Streptomyces zingiberis]
MHTVVERELELGLLLAPERSVPVPARLVYRTDDPYAVHVTFHVGSETPVHWTFARELLVDGVLRPAGEGDVRIRPERSDGRRTLRITLRSPDGEAVLLAPVAPVSAWLERTLRLVEPGRELEQVSFDEALGELLAATPYDESSDGAV